MEVFFKIRSEFELKTAQVLSSEAIKFSPLFSSLPHEYPNFPSGLEGRLTFHGNLNICELEFTSFVSSLLGKLRFSP